MSGVDTKGTHKGAKGIGDGNENILQLSDEALVSEVLRRRQHRDIDVVQPWNLSHNFGASVDRVKKLQGYAANLELESDEITLRGIEEAYGQLHARYATIADTPQRSETARVLLEGLRRAHRELTVSHPAGD